MADSPQHDVLATQAALPKALSYPIERWPVPYRLNNPEQRNAFFEAILEEGTLTAACEKFGMARGSVYRHAAQNAEFKAELDAVCDSLFRVLQEDAIRIADESFRTIRDPIKAALSRGTWEARLRVAGQHRPPVQVNVDNRQLTVTTTDPERARLIEMRNRALADKTNESATKEK